MSSISEQADKYAEVIVGQIADNFQQLNDNIVSCAKLKETLDEYKKAHKQSKWAKFIFEKNIDEYIGYVDEAKKETGCQDYNRIEPLAVGLFGEWGSGKTYQLKLIKHNILYPPKDIKFPQTTIPVFFNAWRFEKEEHIILPLFQTLLQAVEDYEFSLEEKGAKGYRTLSMYLKLGLLSLNKGLKKPDFVSAVKQFNEGEYQKAIDAIINTSEIKKEIEKKKSEETIGEQTLTELLQPDKLDSIYLNIPQWIEKITLFENVNFVFLIDDLDRCLPENTLKMLESIKLFLDVPSCAFVLAVDDDVVERGVVHHYRDYLSIYHNKDTEGSQNAMQHELPITGHEYLEKMIQLPIRLPVIDTVNVREFLVECSTEWIKIVDKTFKETASEKIVKPSEKLLDFFSKYIPPKPRKVKRTAKLFETKLKLLKIAGLLNKVDNEFVAKLTLLELFSPKLLRFIQNQGYGLIFNRLCHFREAGYQFYEQEEHENSLQGKPSSVPMERFLNSLADKKIILRYISATFDKEDNIGYTTKEQNILKRAMKIVDEHYSSRISFDLDVIFDKTYDTEKLKLIVELQDVKENKEISALEMSFSSDFLIRLFRDGDVDAWKEALSSHGSMITKIQLDELIQKAQLERDKTFNNLPFIANPEWVGVIAKYVSDNDYIVLLLASHDVRFKSNETLIFEIDMFQMTFSEYDKYCEIIQKEKPRDEGWGRGRRPVIYVSYEDAKEYIKWLNANANANQKHKYILPREEDKNMYIKDFQSGQNLSDFAWYSRNSGENTHNVGLLKASDIGIYDVYGNVWEWSSQNYSNTNHKKLFGGSWKDNASYLNTIYRLGILSRKNNIGFRLLRN